MKKILSLVFVALFAVSFCATSAFSADPNRQEVTQRFELNSATAEELAGTGAIPLETAKKIVELHDGKIVAQSMDLWTTFTVILPQNSEEEEKVTNS